jgi:uncharacterized membrane protein YhhN
MSNIIFAIAILFALLEWVAVVKGYRRVEYFAKPAVMLALLIWLWQSTGLQSQSAWFAAGLAFSLVGDVLLLWPKWFLPGLVAFLLVHLCYLIGFNPTLPPLHPASLTLAVMVGLIGARIYPRIAAGLKRSATPNLRIPLLVYSFVLSLMLLAGLLTLIRPEWPALSALLVSAGAALFFLSDTLLAWNNFVSPMRRGRLAVMITYYVGQMLITLGAALYLTK